MELSSCKDIYCGIYQNFWEFQTYYVLAGYEVILLNDDFSALFDKHFLET